MGLCHFFIESSFTSGFDYIIQFLRMFFNTILFSYFTDILYFSFFQFKAHKFKRIKNTEAVKTASAKKLYIYVIT